MGHAAKGRWALKTWVTGAEMTLSLSGGGITGNDVIHDWLRRVPGDEGVLEGVETLLHQLIALAHVHHVLHTINSK